METQAITIGTAEFTFPAFLTQIESLPDSPEGTVSLAVQNSETSGFVLAYPIELDSAMPRDEELLIDRIHELLKEDQGLIEVRSGESDGRPFIYSITKTLGFSETGDPLGAQYTLALDMTEPACPIHVQAYFEEANTSGIRDTVVFTTRAEAYATFEEALEGWAVDPYDPEFDFGILMTAAEAASFDAEFPEHPLSLLREMVRALLGE